MDTHSKHLPADERRAVKLQAPVTLAASQNQGEVTTAAIAHPMNSTPGGLFRHVPTKEAIWEAVIQWLAQVPHASRMTLGELQRAESTPARRMAQTLIQSCGERLHQLVDTPRAFAVGHDGVGSAQ